MQSVSRSGEDTRDQTATNAGPPPEKRRKKERGQNKRRPRAAKVNHADQLCPSLYQGSESTSTASCHFGDKCRYCHNCAEFLANKAPDIRDSCFLFTTLGRCPYGLACRYGNSHMTTDQQNVTNDEVYDPDRVATTLNIVSRTLQEKLRKKKVELPKSDRFLCEFSAVQNGSEKFKSEATDTQTGDANSGGGERGEEGGRREGEVLGTESVQKEGAGVEERMMGETGSEREKGLSAQKPSDDGRTVGALTDEDLITVRPAEKRKVNVVYIQV